MYKVGQKVINKDRETWLSGYITRPAYLATQVPPHQFAPTETLYEVKWENEYVGISWEVDLVPIPDNISEEQKEAILSLLCSK